MMDLIISCCGTVKSVDIFQQARVACTQMNWLIPPPDPLNKLMQILSGNEPEYDNQIAFSSLLAHLEQDQSRKNVTYVLKNLILLDLTVEQRLFLSHIGRYYNSQLIYMQGDSNTNKAVISIRDLIASYYVYIKEKSKYYQLQSKELLEQGDREAFMDKANSITILNEINVCFKIQNLILDVNSKFKNGDKSTELIRFIFGLMLKTYIFCHSIVSIALKAFAKRIPDLNKYDLEYIKKFAAYFNKDYSKNFILFMTTNQSIPYFQNVDYKSMVLTDSKMLEIIDTQLQYIYEDPGICPEPVDLSPEQLKTMVQEKKEEASRTNETINIVEQQENLTKRSQFNVPAEDGKQFFVNYPNFYSDMWQSEQNEPETAATFMDPYEIFSYYGAPDPSERSQSNSQEQQQEEESPEEGAEKQHAPDKEISVNQ